MNIDDIRKIVSQKNTLQPLRITNGWSVEWNHFTEANPLLLTSDSPEWVDFSEDMAYFKYSISEETKYEIDLGWYGGLNSNGYYSVSLFLNGDVVSTYESKDMDEITAMLNYLFLVPYLPLEKLR